MSNRMTDPTELQEESALTDWVALQERAHPELELLYANLNGGYRQPKVAADMKRMGSRRGVPDRFLPIARHGYHGLYIEMKTRTGTTSKEQDAFIARLRAEGFAVDVCHGWIEAAQSLCWYLGIRMEETDA